MTGDDLLNLDEAFRSGDVSRAWDVWSSAAEASFADAYQFAGGPVLERGLVLGRGSFLVRTVRLGGRRFKAVGDVVHAMIRDGVTLAQSLELTAQWNGIIRIGPVHLLTVQDFDLAGRGGLGEWCQVFEGLHLWLSDFIHRVVVLRRQETIRGMAELVEGRSSYSSLQVALVGLGSPLLFYYSVTLSSLLVVLGLWLIRPGLMRNSERLGFPTFVLLGDGRTFPPGGCFAAVYW